MSTINNGIPFVPENTIDPAAGLNLSLNTIDALLQVLVVSVGLNTPPGSSANGARFIVGTEPTGPWAGQANKMAHWLDGAWQFFEARYALNADDGLFYVRAASTWASAPLPANVQALAELTGAADRAPYFTGEGAMALAVLTAQARIFLAAVDAAGQRAAMGLGTAAIATLQTSAVDTTADRAMIVSAFGVGNSSNMDIPGNNADTLGVSGVYRCVSSTVGIPSAGLWQIQHWQQGSNVAVQIAQRSNAATNELYIRNRNTSGAWSPWSQVYHTSNLTPNLLTSFTLDTLPAAAANARLQVFCSNLAVRPAPVFSDGTNWRRVSDNTIAN